MALTNEVSNALGPSFTAEFFDASVSVILAPGQTLLHGQALCRSPFAPTKHAADVAVFCSDPNAGDLIGIYQGDTIKNTSNPTDPIYVPVLVRRFGWGKMLVVMRTTDPNLLVGSRLGIVPATTYPVIAAGTFGTYAGVACATGLAVSRDDVILATPSVQTLVTVNAYINVS